VARSARWRSVRLCGKRGHLIKILWHDGIGMSRYAKRLERGRFLWAVAG
jgi:transposase